MRVVGVLEQLQIIRRDGAFFHQHIHVDQAAPVVGAEQDDGDRLGLLGLHQGHHFKQLIERSEPAGESHQCLGPHHEMHFAGREVVELEAQRRRHIGVGALFMGQGDVQPGGEGAHLVRPPVGRFHDARAAAGADEEALALGLAGAVAGDQAGKQAGVFIVFGISQVPLRDSNLCRVCAQYGSVHCSLCAFGRRKARAAENDHRVFYPLGRLVKVRLEHLQLDADATGLPAEQKFGVGESQAVGVLVQTEALVGVAL